MSEPSWILIPKGGQNKPNRSIWLRQQDLSEFNLDCRKLKGEIAFDATDKKQYQWQKSKCSTSGRIRSDTHDRLKFAKFTDSTNHTVWLDTYKVAKHLTYHWLWISTMASYHTNMLDSSSNNHIITCRSRCVHLHLEDKDTFAGSFRVRQRS